MIRDIIITKKTEDRMTLIVLYTIIIVLSTVLLRYLWNESLVKHITVLKPIKTMLDALLLSIGLMVIRGC
jgi:hypothetical protein|tara:strand:+ start:6817 stop:7026 length:210 start_codon:yes stop_codon:yes gene_type:complete